MSLSSSSTVFLSVGLCPVCVARLNRNPRTKAIASGGATGKSLNSLARDDFAAMVRKEVHAAVVDELAHVKATGGGGGGGGEGAAVPRKAGPFHIAYTTTGGGDNVAVVDDTAALGGREEEIQSAAIDHPASDDDPNSLLTDEERFLRSKADLPKSLYGRMNQLVNVPGFPHSPPQVLSTTHPKAYLFRNFLSAEECEHLIALAKEQLAPSTVVGTSGPVSSSIRTSAGMFLFKGQTTVVRAIEERIAAASGLPEPNGEGMQILRYENGQKYEPHYDYFHDAPNSSPRRGGQRMATMLIYLKDTEEGGETIFPQGKKPNDFDHPDGGSNEWSKCARSGLPVKSVRGDAVLFWSLQEDYNLDPGSLHGACPVKRGMKWTAVKWIRVAKFDGGFNSPLPMPPLAVSDRSAGECRDEWTECAEWARKGWCDRNPEFMTSRSGARDSKGPACPQSCNVPCS